jgi:hypothetical protein
MLIFIAEQLIKLLFKRLLQLVGDLNDLPTALKVSAKNGMGHCSALIKVKFVQIIE